MKSTSDGDGGVCSKAERWSGDSSGGIWQVFACLWEFAVKNIAVTWKWSIKVIEG